MANIKVELPNKPIDGQPVTFLAPCDCGEVTGLKVVYGDNSKVLTFRDAGLRKLTGVGNLFKRGAYVKAILDVTNGIAYLQNACTNGYLEGELAKRYIAIEDTAYPSCYYRTTADGKKEWINPPMVPNVEYLTTRRYNGKSVYTRLLSIDSLPNNGLAIKSLPNFAYADLVGIDSIVNNGDGTISPLPPTVRYKIKSREIRITTTEDMSECSAMLQLYYTMS